MAFKKILTIIIIALFSNTTLAEITPCDDSYIIQANDTLSSIASKVYNASHKWNIIYIQNKNIIGDNPAKLKVGSSLFIPCIDKNFFARKITPQQKIANKALHVEFVTAEWPPYIGKKLPNQGMLLHITKEIFSKIPNASYSVDYISDWSAHINILLKKKKYDIGPGWYYQDCSDLSKVPESAKIRCEYYFSDPIYEEIITIYNKKDKNTAITNLAELKNKTLCQPKGYLLFDYKKSGLENGENFTLIEAPSVQICMEKLRDDQIQYVAINKNEGDQVISDLGLKNEIENKSTSPVDIRSIHYIIHKTHPKAKLLMSKINNGLRQLKKTGKLFEIQSKHIQNFQNNL